MENYQKEKSDLVNARKDVEQVQVKSQNENRDIADKFNLYKEKTTKDMQGVESRLHQITT